MNEPRMVFCRKLQTELPGLPFKPFTTDFGQLLYENISMQAWQMWLQESPRYVNTYGVDLASEQGRAFMEQQMRIFFGFEEGEMASTAWRPTDGAGENKEEG
jgi:Fe-S cluster biosynthesis and repair protein YggX